MQRREFIAGLGVPSRPALDTGTLAPRSRTSSRHCHAGGARRTPFAKLEMLTAEQPNT
jgi:hypothetical protein